jgi:DNA recombination protein RmuC
MLFCERRKIEMPAIIPIVSLVVLLAILLLLLLRKPSDSAIQDPRLAQLLAADLPAILARADARGEALDQHLRAELAQIRSDAATEAARGREAASAASAALRTEIVGNINTLGETLRSGLESFRTDNAAAAERLRAAVEVQLSALTQRFNAFTTETLQHHNESRDALHSRLTELGAAQTVHQDKLRTTVEERLNQLNQTNAAKLEEMRLTVDEKLHATLQTRLTESFGAVTEQLSKVHAGLGEMNTLSTGVNDLNRIFSNVKSRGGFAEVQLGKLLEQVLAPGQYVENANVRPGTQEVVEFAVRFPGSGGDVLLPIDAKFPREDWERLETAYESGAAAGIEQARKAFDAAIRVEGKRICSKYINEPVTTPYAIMFLPTEGLYAEVLRRDGLQADLHQNCRVMVAGPSNLYALLTSFQLGFRMLNLQKKGNEVWKVLAKTQNEFRTFEILMGSMEKQVGTVQNTIQKLNVRTRAINRTLSDVGADGAREALEPGTPSGTFDGMLPMLSAEED